MNPWAIRAVAVAAFLVSGTAAVAATAIIVSGQSITLTNPSGLTALRNKETPYYRFGETIQATNGNTMKATFLEPAAAAVADASKIPENTRWAIVYSLGILEGKTVTVAMFNKSFLPGVEANLAKTFRDADFQRKNENAFDRGAQQLGKDLRTDPMKIRVGETVPFGVFAKKENYLVYGVGSRVKNEIAGSKAYEQPIVMAIAFIVVKNRLFCLGVYNNYSTAADVDEAKNRAIAWADAITRANP